MKKKIMGMILVVAVLGTVAYMLIGRSTAIAVTTAPVIEGVIEKYVEELAVVLAEEKEGIYADATGRITEIMADIGQQVEKGEVLLSVEDQQLLRQIQGIEAEEAALLAQYQQAVSPVDQREIEKLELDLINQEKTLQEAERNADNQSQLFEAGAISRETLENSLDSLEIHRNNFKKLKLDLDLLSQPNTATLAAQYQAQLEQLAVQKEAIESQREEHIVKAPMAGTVLMKSVEKGSYLQPGMLLMEIGNTAELYLEADILVGDIALVKEGAPVIITHQNLGIAQLEGTVRKIYPQAFRKVSDLGIEQKRIKVEIDTGGEGFNLKPGYDLDIKIVTEKSENTLLIPESALFQQGDQYYVYVNENNQARRKEIQIGIQSQKQVEVVSGLQKGELVVLFPGEALKEGIGLKENKTNE